MRASTGAIVETMTSVGPSEPRRNITVPAAYPPRVELETTSLLPNAATRSTVSLNLHSATRAAHVELASGLRAQELPSSLESPRLSGPSDPALGRSSMPQDPSFRRQSELEALKQDHSNKERGQLHRSHEQNQSLPEVPELETTQSTRRIRTEGIASTSTLVYKHRVPAVELDADSRMPSRAAQSTSSSRNLDESGNHKQRREWRPKDPGRRLEPGPAPVELSGDVRPRPRRHHSSLPRERAQPIELPSHVPLSSIRPLSSLSSTISERTESSSSPFVPQSTREVPAASSSGASSRTVVGETGGRVERRRSYVSLSSQLQRPDRRHRQPTPPPSWHGEYSDDDIESSVF